MDNKINFVIPEEVENSVKQKIRAIQTELSPYVISLTPDERRELPKMSDKTQPFVEKALDYAVTAPQFAPPYMDVEGLVKDMKVHSQLTTLLREVRKLFDNLDDTVMEAGAESYMCALTYYNSSKMAAKMDVPDAKSISEDLGKRFVRAKNDNDDDTED